MKLTICFDDICLPLPPMRRPDVRQRVIEAVLDLAAAAGVDDVHLIAALALHRRMTEAELRHAVGDRVYDAFAPHGLLYNHDAEDPDNLAFLGTTDAGRGGGDQQAGGRERPDRLRQHQPRVDGRRLEVDRHRPRLVPVAAPPPQRAAPCSSRAASWTATAASCTRATGAWARCCASAGRQGLPDRDDAQQRHVRHLRPDVGPPEARVGVDGARPGHVHRHEGRARPHAGEGPPQDLQRLAGALRHHLGAGRRGRGRARGHHRQRLRAAARADRGPDRHPHDGPALHLPVQRELGDEPDPRDVPRARLLLQHVPGQAARARGRRAHHEPPDAVGVPPRPPPELHRLLRAGAGRHHRPARDRGPATRSSSPRTSGTATSTARATPTTASTRSTCGTGARTRCSTSAG